jgi:hypothetical protein
MTAFRVNALLCTLTLTVSLTAVAQAAEPTPGPASAPPRGLSTEPQDLSSEAEDVTPVAGQADLPAEQTLPDQAGRPSGPRVTMTGLSAINPDSTGLITEASGGFGSNLWAGSQRGTVAVRFAQLPAAPGSPAMQGLLRRLLLSSAPPPSGAAPPDEPSMLALRVSRLLANGWITEAEALAVRSARDDNFARQVLAESLLLQGRDADACSDATSLRQSSNDPYWLKLRVLCHLLNNENSAASLTLDVMTERGVDDDVFFAMAGSLAEGKRAKPVTLTAPSGLHLALMHHAGLAPSAALAGWAPAATMLSQESTDPVIRLTASERAAIAGLTPVDNLREVYDVETFTPAQLADPPAVAQTLPPARANALFYQAIARRDIMAARAAAFAAGLHRAESQNRFALFAELMANPAVQVAPSVQTAWLAPYAERTLHYTGNDRAAKQWLLVLTSPTDAPTVNAIQMHAGLTRPTPENVATMQGAMSWLGQRALQPGPTKDWLMDRATREIPLLDALGYIIPPDAQWAVSATTSGVAPSGPATEALAALGRSAAERRTGETLLNALVALGQGGPARAQGQTTVRVVKALMTLGLREEARAIAIEAILSAPVRTQK